jgi:transcriptional regulator with XRE-family HTH domain
MKPGKVISVRLKTLRESACLSQQEVAERAHLSLSLVAKLEQGKKGDPRASTLLALADALGVKPGAILDELFPPAVAKPKPADPTAAPVEREVTAENGKKKKKKKKKKKNRKQEEEVPSD